MARGIRLIDHQEVQAATERLALKLSSRFSDAELKSFRFAAIPRGGLFVLGYLSYCLSLTPEQFQASPDATLVVVDDCSLSGARFARYRESHPGAIVFAHLFSSPDLRTAIEQEPGVVACLAADDLSDLTPSTYPDEAAREEWRRQWQTRQALPRYWIGIPERIAFPWTEPDTLGWNTARGQLEVGWRYVSPDRCLHNRYELGVPLSPGITRRFRVPDHVAYQCHQDGVNLLDFSTEQYYRLQGVAFAMWRALAAHGDPAAAADYVSAHFDVAPAVLERDVSDFAAALLELRLLERSGEE